MVKRNVGVSILLSILTCGIYTIFWIISVNNDAARLSGDKEDGGMAILLMLITCGIYSFVWMYKMGDKIERAGGKNDGTIYLILSIFGLGLVSIALMQTELNRL
jgi:hypothetical protein